MAKRWFSADLHLGGLGIIQYASRPFKTVEDMNMRLIANINARCKPEDTLIHIGDFANYGRAKGLEGSRVNPQEYVNNINCNLILLEGDHDHNNRVKTVGKYLFLEIAGLQVIACHHPTFYEDKHDAELMRFARRTCGVALVGHIHERWKYRVDTVGGTKLININVGVDQWGYKPINDREIFEFCKQVSRKDSGRT